MAQAPGSGAAPIAAASAAALTPIAASLRYDSRLAEFKQPFGAQPAKTWIDFQLTALPGVDKIIKAVKQVVA